MIASEMSSNTSATHPDVVCSPLVQHPSRPVILWAAGCLLFAFNITTGKFEAERVKEHREPIRSIDFCPNSENADPLNSVAGCWVVAAEDKQITIFEDETFRVREKFLLSKRPAAVRCSRNGLSLIWGDKFGELFDLSIPELRRLTVRVVGSTVRHLHANKKDSLAANMYRDVLSQFAPEELQKIDGEKSKDDKVMDDQLKKEDKVSGCMNDEDDDDLLTPFAGHLSQITALEISADRKFLLSGDRDEKLRVGSMDNLFITTGYGLGHTEFITALSCPSTIPTISASASGDRSLRLWDISGGVAVDQDGCIELSSVILSQVPSCVEFSDLSTSFLVVCEGLDGVVVVPLVTEEMPSGNKLWKFDEQNIRIIQLPSCPMAILPSEINCSHLALFSSSSPAPQSPVPVFYWTDRTGRLQPPVSLISGEALLTSEWGGVKTGVDIPTAMVRWWKHNREPSALTEDERLKKRLKHGH